MDCMKYLVHLKDLLSPEEIKDLENTEATRSVMQTLNALLQTQSLELLRRAASRLASGSTKVA